MPLYLDIEDFADSPLGDLRCVDSLRALPSVRPDDSSDLILRRPLRVHDEQNVIR